MENLIDLTQYLPHREPFLLVDNITSLDKDGVITVFYISPDCIFVDEQHLNEFGLIENAAQNCSAMISQMDKFIDQTDVEHYSDMVGYISTIKKIAVHQLPKEDTVITTRSRLISSTNLGNSYLLNLSVATYNENKDLLFEAEMVLFIQDNKG